MVELIKQDAINNNIPIIEDETLEYITNLIKTNSIKSILEIGSAIGYSAIMFASINKNIKITTIERDLNRYTKALENIKNNNLNSQINIINEDALNNIKINNKFDLIFIDGAKSKSIDFFNIYKHYLNDNGIIITDNIKFHGLVENPTITKNKRTKALLKKISNYIFFLKENQEFKTEFINIGDGLSMSRKK